MKKIQIKFIFLGDLEKNFQKRKIYRSGVRGADFEHNFIQRSFNCRSVGFGEQSPRFFRKIFRKIVEKSVEKFLSYYKLFLKNFVRSSPNFSPFPSFYLNFPILWWGGEVLPFATPINMVHKC